MLHRMRLPYVRAAAPEVLATAKAQRWDPAEVLRVLLLEEVRGRDAATQRMRRKAAGFPTGETFATWREHDSSIEPATQSALRTLEWIGRAENLAISGPSGTGKSHFVEALAHAAIDADLRVAWFTLESLTATIGRARADATIAKVVARICRSDLIVVDDIGSLPAGQDAAEGVLPRCRRRLRTPVRRRHQQHQAVRLRHDHAQDPRDDDRRPAAPPRPPDPHRRPIPTPGRSRCRQGSGAPGLTRTTGDQLTAHQELCCPRTWESDVRPPGGPAVR